MANNTLHPTQIGYIPTGVGTTVQVSSVVLGRTISGTYEGVGFGQNGRPDYAELVQINFTSLVAGVPTQKGTITLNVNDIVSAKTANPNVPTNLDLVLREVAVCDNGVSKRMMIIASQTYSA